MWTRRGLLFLALVGVALLAAPGSVRAQDDVPVAVDPADVYFIGPWVETGQKTFTGHVEPIKHLRTWYADRPHYVLGVAFDVVSLTGKIRLAGVDVAGLPGVAMTRNESPRDAFVGQRFCILPDQVVDSIYGIEYGRYSLGPLIGCDNVEMTTPVRAPFGYHDVWSWGWAVSNWDVFDYVGHVYLIAYDVDGEGRGGSVVNPFPPTPTPVPTPTPTLEPWAGFSVPVPGSGSVGGGYSPPALGPTPTLYPYATSDGVYYAPTPPPGGWPDMDGDGVPDAPGSPAGPVVVITPYVPPTPTPAIPEPQAVAYAEVGSGATFDGAGVGSLVLREYDYGCPINVNTRATGAVRLCVRYIEVVGWNFLGADIPMWPFAGVLVLLVVGFIIRR